MDMDAGRSMLWAITPPRQHTQRNLVAFNAADRKRPITISISPRWRAFTPDATRTIEFGYTQKSCSPNLTSATHGRPGGHAHDQHGG